MKLADFINLTSWDHRNANLNNKTNKVAFFFFFLKTKQNKTEKTRVIFLKPTLVQTLRGTFTLSQLILHLAFLSHKHEGASGK